MGQDFVRKKNGSFVRQRDKRFADQTTPDIFGAIAPEMVVNLCGTAVGAVSIAQELWAPEITATDPIQFYAGTSPAVRLDGAAADHLRGQYMQSQSPVVAQVVDIEQDHGLVTLRVGVPS